MSLPLITPDRIERWGVEDPDAPHRLPELIRRLIQTSNQQLTRLEMSSGRQINQGGYDGIVEAGPYLGAGRRFVPVGRSVWELGARRGDPLKKLKADYDKRTADPGPFIQPAETTFVLVTPHILSDKARAWAELLPRALEAPFPWRRLEVYDAEELRDWLEAAPAVAAWFGATCLGLPSALMSLEGALEHLAARTPQRIPPHILLPERDAEAAAVRRWAEAALDEPRGRALTLQAPSEEEALAFVCAVLDDERHLVNPHHATFHARTLIATTRAAWEYVLSEHPGARLLLLPMPGVAPRTPGERRVHALLPVEPPNEAEVILPPLRIGAFAGGLVHKAGLSVEEANTGAAQGNATWAGLALNEPSVFHGLAQDATRAAGLLLSPASAEARAILRDWAVWLRHQQEATLLPWGMSSLGAWLSAVLRQVEDEAEDPRGAARRFAAVLANLPVDPRDRSWPLKALREALESDLPLKAELISGFQTAELGPPPDPSDVHFIELGGIFAEREVKRREAWLKQLEYTWPTSAEIVQRSLSYWSGELERRDRSTELLHQRRLYSLTEGQEGHLTLKQAQEAGVDAEIPKLLEAGVLQRVGPGVYRAKSVDPGDEAHLLALWLQFEQEGVFSHGTALGLLNISDYEPFQVELTLPRAWEARGVRPPPDTILYFEDIPRAELTWHGSVPMTTAARTLEDCASVHIAPDLLEQAVEEGLRRGRFTREEIPKTLEALKPYQREVS